jgi:ParB family chromosome partitioning protein
MADGELIQQSMSNEHYTPARYIEAAREALGGIDLDPASCAAANETVRASTFSDAQRNGLAQEWHGRVWLNPPYGDLAGEFITKLLAEIAVGHVSEAICLVNAHCTDAKWFRQLWDGGLCFTDHRINFTGDETRSGSTHGSVFVYFGPDRQKFKSLFQRFGAYVVRG